MRGHAAVLPETVDLKERNGVNKDFSILYEEVVVQLNVELCTSTTGMQ